MTQQHYFNSSGEWIAFRRTPTDRYLFDRHGNWVGWFPWNDNEAVDSEGNYLGTIVDGNRFYRRTKAKLDRPHPGFAVPPGPTVKARHPGYAAYSGPPLGFDDAVFTRPKVMRSPAARAPRKLPPPRKTPLQIWMERLGLGGAADAITRMFQPEKTAGKRPRR